MSSSSLRSKAALTAVATAAVMAVPAAGLMSSNASAAAAIGAHVSVPSKLELSQLVAIPHSSSVAVLGYRESTARTVGLEVPKGSHYVLRSFGKSVYPTKVVAVSTSSFWAIATKSTGGSEVLRLSGSKWKSVKLPAAAKTASFNSISASSASNVWVSGYLLNPDGSGQEVLHWNGKKWAILSLGDTNDTTVTAIATSSSSNVWAVDGADVLHFNGKAWSHPDNEELGAINSVGTTSSSSAWFLGGNGAGPAVTHWNGKAFKSPAVPGAKRDSINSLSVAGSSAWIAGYTYNAKNASHQVVFRSTGSKWKAVRTPTYHIATALSVAASSSSSAEVAVSEQIGTSCTNYRAVPILLSLSASKTKSTSKGKSYRTGCG